MEIHTFIKSQINRETSAKIQQIKEGKYEPGIVDDSNDFAVTINGNVDLMISETDLDTLDDDLLK